MNFDFSEDDYLVRDQATRLLANHCSLGVVRAVLDGQADAAEPVWQALADRLGGIGLPVENRAYHTKRTVVCQ